MPSLGFRHNLLHLAPTPRSRLIAEYGVNGFFGRVTSARATVSPLVQNASGTYVQYAANNVAISGGDSVACWPATTNLLSRSEEVDHGDWSIVRLSATANAETAPDGTLTADKLVEDTSTNTHELYRSIVVSNAPYTYSIFAKAAERDWICVRVDGASTFFDLSNGVVGTVGSGCVASIEEKNNGWYRCSSTKTHGAGTKFPVIRTATADATDSYAGDGSSGLFVWGMQFTQSSYPLYYVPTTTAAASVNASEPAIAYDTALTENFAISFRWTPAAAGQGTIWLWGNYTDASNAFGILHDGTNVIFRNRVSGTNHDATKALTYAADTEYLIQARHDAINGLDIAVDRVVGTNDSTTTAVTAASTAKLGQDGNDASHMLGTIQDVVIDKHAPGWSDAEWLAS